MNHHAYLMTFLTSVDKIGFLYLLASHALAHTTLIWSDQCNDAQILRPVCHLKKCKFWIDSTLCYATKVSEKCLLYIYINV